MKKRGKGWEAQRRALTGKEISGIRKQLKAIPHLMIIKDPRDKELNKQRGRKPKSK